jgi:hypothetical protein
MVNYLFLLAGLVFSIQAQAQASKNSYKGFPSLTWPKLYDIAFVKSTDKLGEYDKPVFSAAAKTLNGKKVTLPGYIVPFSTGLKSSHLMLSSLPLNACFFCGAGGPETVVEVFLKKEITYTERPLEIQGILKLNDRDPEKMIYLLEQAEVTGEVEF